MDDKTRAVTTLVILCTLTGLILFAILIDGIIIFAIVALIWAATIVNLGWMSLGME